MLRHLWLTQGKIPEWIVDDYTDMKLCEMYHCLPSELDGEDYHRTQRHMTIKGAIETYRAREARSKAGK